MRGFQLFSDLFPRIQSAEERILYQELTKYLLVYIKYSSYFSSINQYLKKIVSHHNYWYINTGHQSINSKYIKECSLNVHLVTKKQGILHHQHHLAETGPGVLLLCPRDFIVGVDKIVIVITVFWVVFTYTSSCHFVVGVFLPNDVIFGTTHCIWDAALLEWFYNDAWVKWSSLCVQDSLAHEWKFWFLRRPDGV